MISERIQHSYKINDARFFTLIKASDLLDTRGEVRDISFSLYSFDEQGLCWLQVTHVSSEWLKRTFGYLYQQPHLIVEDPQLLREPNNPPSPDEYEYGTDLGYSIEALREAFGMELLHLRNLNLINEGTQ